MYCVTLWFYSHETSSFMYVHLCIPSIKKKKEEEEEEEEEEDEEA